MARQVRSLYGYEAQEADELTIATDEILTVIDTAVGNGWWEGTNAMGETGFFPGAYVEQYNVGDDGQPPRSAPPISPGLERGDSLSINISQNDLNMSTDATTAHILATSTDVSASKVSFVSLDSLRNILECPICLNQFVTAPIFRCENGHLLCKECRRKVEKCPECRIHLGYSRCLTSERIVMNVIPSDVACTFVDRGCKAKFSKAQMASHELECTYSLVKCSTISGVCRENIPLLKIWEHIKANHKVRSSNGGNVFGMVKESIRQSSKDFSLDPIHSLYDENHFFTNITKKGNFWHFWVYLMGSEKEAERYECRITVHPFPKTISCSTTSELTFKGPCVSSLFKSNLSIIDGDSKMCHLVVSKSTMENFVEAGKTEEGLKYKFFISKLAT